MPLEGKARAGILAGALALILALSGGWGLDLGAEEPPAGASLLSRTNELPIQIEAENGIEWVQDESVVRARGNARAQRGDVEVKADVLSAFYREGATGDSEIWRLEADGNVAIRSPAEEALADKGVYDVDNAVLVLTGEKPVQVRTKDGVVTAEKQMEYWEKRQLLVARGNAQATQGDRSLRAEILVAHVMQTEAGSAIERVEAYEDILITTPEERVRADRGTYRPETGIAELNGAVKVTRGDNQLNGCRALVNVKTGRSTLFACPQEGTRPPRVEGLIIPEGRATPRPGAGKEN